MEQENIKHWKVGSSLENAIKNCLDITKDSRVSLRFESGVCTVSSFLNYFGASIDIPAGGNDCDSFSVTGTALIKAIGGKEGVILSKKPQQSVLNFTYGSMRGELPTAPASLVGLLKIDDNTDIQEMSKDFKASVFSVFDKFKINSKKVNVDKLDLQMTCKQNHLLYLVGDPDYWAWHEDLNSSLEDFESRINLKYMMQIEKNFKIDTDFKIGLNQGVIVVQGDNCILNFPQLSFETAAISLEDLAQYQKDYFGHDPKGVAIVDTSALCNFIKQAVGLFQDDLSSSLHIGINESKLHCNIQSTLGKLEDDFDAKIKGNVDFNIDLFNLCDCLSKLSGLIKIALYDACILISSKQNPNLKYMFSYVA